MSGAPSDGLPATPLRLQVHPGEQGPAGLGVSASLDLVASDDGPGWLLRYRLEGDIDALALPPPAVGATDGLWRHTCLEAFVSAKGDAGYREFNFSPSGQWAAYRFAGERLRDTATAPDQPAPAIQLAVTPTLLTLDVHLPLDALPSPAPHLALALCAVIEEHDGRLSYWALQHPKARPDFHHPAGRALRLALPAN